MAGENSLKVCIHHQGDVFDEMKYFLLRTVLYLLLWQRRDKTCWTPLEQKKRTDGFNELLVTPLNICLFRGSQLFRWIFQGRRRRGAGGARASPLSKVGGHKWVCAPPLLGRANVLIALFAHILWLKTQFFSKFSWLASLANFSKSIFSKFC